MSKRTMNTDGSNTMRPKGPADTMKGYSKPNKTRSGATRPSSTAAKTGSGQSKSGAADKGAISETPGSTRRTGR
jgi:hypothetical protein